MNNRNAPADPFAAARIVAVAMMTGVILFYAVGWTLAKTGTNAHMHAPVSENVAAVIYGVFAVAALLAAIFLQRSTAGLKAAAVLPRLVIAWALLEMPALLAGVCFMIFGMRNLLYAAAIIYFVGMISTFPRQEWFTNQEPAAHP